MNFVERVLKLIEEKGISKNKLLTDLKLSKNSFVNWEDRGTIPGGDTIVKIADYFDCSVDYLLGRKSGHNISTGDVTNSNVISGSNNTLNEHLSLSTQEQDLIKIFREADGKTQIKIMQFIYDLEK